MGWFGVQLVRRYVSHYEFGVWLTADLFDSFLAEQHENTGSSELLDTFLDRFTVDMQKLVKLGL